MSIDQLVPMWRFTDRMVRSGLVMAWRLATSPTRTSPVLEKATTDGVVRPPSALGMTTGSPAPERSPPSWSCRGRFRRPWTSVLPPRLGSGPDGLRQNLIDGDHYSDP